MSKRRILPFLLSILLLLGAVPWQVFAIPSDPTVREKTSRIIYLHGFDDVRSLSDTTDIREIKKGDTANVYLALDAPNKASDDSEWEQQFNLGGFTVKIYYDTKYFELAQPSNAPIEYKFVTDWTDSSVETGTVPDDFSDEIGYMTVSAGTHVKDGNASQRIGYAYATIFYKGGKLPEPSTPDSWYNILRLPLRSIETGRTSVYIDLSSDDEYTIELFAKNVPNSDVDGDGIDDIERNFAYTAENSGIFNFNIIDESKPEPPVSDPTPSIYSHTQYVKLFALEKGQIYFTLDPNASKEEFELYTDALYPNGIEISYTQDIRCYLVRDKDSMESNIATYHYEILPMAPKLFNSEKVFISNSYCEPWTEDGGYYVSAADRDDTAAPITDGNTIYYTFTSLDADLISDDPQNQYVGTDPDVSWVPITANDGFIPDIIDTRRTMRLVTVNKWGHSDVSTYYLGIKPGLVTASPDSGMTDEKALSVTLICSEPDSAEIYYTRNDGDPRVTGALYTGPLSLTYDTTIRTAAYYRGEWGDVSAYWYRFHSDIYAFYPSGEYVGSVDVGLFPKVEGKKIEYMIGDGGTWSDYDDPIHVEENTVIRARIKDEPGEETPFYYEIKPLAPIFEPESTQLTSPGWISIYTPESTAQNTSRYSLRFTTDGSDPRTSPTANTAENSAYDETSDEARVYITGYTEIRAVVIKDGELYSDVVTNTYEVVSDRPAAPVTTVKSGYYTREIGDDVLETLFDKVPEGTEIYYTVSRGSAYVSNPDPNEAGNGTTILYDGTPIKIEGNTVIKAVAVSTIEGTVVKSNVGVYSYTVIPDAPVAMPSGLIDRHALIPVDALSGEGCYIEYEVNGNTGRFENTDGERFYIDSGTGNVYRDPDLSGEPLYVLTGGNFDSPITLRVKTVLDGVESVENSYAYVIDTQADVVPPYADKQSGTYIESNSGFEVKLYSIYGDDPDVVIQWKYGDEDTWRTYDGTPITFDTTDKIINLKAYDTDTGKESGIETYVYYFAPPAPTISLPSGLYPEGTPLSTTVAFPDDMMSGGRYRIYFQISDLGHASFATDVDIPVNESMSVKAFIKNENTGRISEVVSEYYILTEDTANSAVRILAPYTADRISAHLLGTGQYAEGIKLAKTGTGTIKYQYCYKIVGGNWTAWTDVLTYDDINPVIPTVRMDNLRIIAWIDGDRENTEIEHTIDFIHLDAPTVRLSSNPDSNGNYTKNTNFWVQNEYPDIQNVIVYYTTDGSDPTESRKRTSFSTAKESSKETLINTTTVKAVYFSACGRADCDACGSGHPENCPIGVYGRVAEFIYPVKTSSNTGGGGGGGGSVTRPSGNTTPTPITEPRKYTKDIFGHEYTAHKGYINGYPDGSVQPEGFITREEMSVILYRITQEQYRMPFAPSGNAFPDVEADRWSVTEIEYMTFANVIVGYPDGTFMPGKSLTRAEFAALIYRYTGLKKADADNPFSDLGSSHWAYSDILSLVSTGLVEGYEDGTFRPENTITRAEVMTVINKLLGRKPLESYVKSLAFNPYNDLYDDKWYYVTVLEATITHDYWLDDTGYEYKWENWK